MYVGYCGRYCLTSAKGILCFASRFCEWHSASGGGTVRYTQWLPLLNLKAQWGGKRPQLRLAHPHRGELSPVALCGCAFLTCSYPRYRAWTLVLPSDVLRLEFQHHFNVMWLLLKTAVLLLFFFHSLVPHSCLPYAVIAVCVVWLIRKEMIRQKDYLSA